MTSQLNASDVAGLLRLVTPIAEGFRCPVTCWDASASYADEDKQCEHEFLPRFRSGCSHELRWLELRDELRRNGVYL